MLLSAWEDFTGRTLSSIPGLLAQLAYVIGLRGEDGNYRHWGLARTHGSDVASNAICRAHMGLLAQLLRTPLPQLLRELEEPPAETPRFELDKPGFLRLLMPGAPAAAHIATARHVRATILALRALQDAARRRQTTHQAA